MFAVLAGPFAVGVFEVLLRDPAPRSLVRELDDVQGRPRIPTGTRHDQVDDTVRDCGTKLVCTAPDDDRKILGRERLELVHLRTREQSGVDLVVRVLGCRTDHRYEAFLNR